MIIMPSNVGGITAAGPVTLKGFAGADKASSIAIPSHEAGDLIVIFTHNPFGTLAKPSPSDTVPFWTTAASMAGGNDNAAQVAYCVATSSNTTSGTWPNGYGMIAAVLSGQGPNPIGGVNLAPGYTNTPIAPAVTLSKTDGTSQLLHFAILTTTKFPYAFSEAGYTAQLGGAANSSQVRLATKNVTTSDGQLWLGYLETPTNTGCATVEITN